jgi:hypothetical protein
VNRRTDGVAGSRIGVAGSRIGIAGSRWHATMGKWATVHDVTKGRPMKKTLAVGMTALALLVASCGSDGGTELTGAQADAAASVVKAAKGGGIDLDEDCVGELTAQLSDEDAEKLAAAEDGSADLSPEGEALGDDVLKCAGQDQLVDLFITGMSQSGQNVDEDCAKDALADFDVAEIVSATNGGDPPADLIAALVPCLDVTDTTTTEG